MCWSSWWDTRSTEQHTGARPALLALLPWEAARGGAGGMWGEGPGGRAVPLEGTVGEEQAPGLQQNQGVSWAEVPKPSQSDGSTEQWSPQLGEGGWWEGQGTAGALQSGGLGSAPSLSLAT